MRLIVSPLEALAGEAIMVEAAVEVWVAGAVEEEVAAVAVEEGDKV